MSRFRATIALCAALACAACFTGAASATPPVHSSFLGAGTAVVPAGDLCSFDVSYAFHINSNETRFFDAAGNQTMFQNHQAEQDTFSANGKTLVSQVYHVTFQGFFDENGDLTLVGNGVFIRVPLPGGGVFIGAGRVNSFGNSSIVLSPDHGAFKNVDRFCAALSP